MYVRFVVGGAREDHRKLTGIIQEACQLHDENQLEDYEADWLLETMGWLNKNLPVPPYSRSEWPPGVKAWFKESSQRSIERMWDLVALLREHDKPVRLLRSKTPGWRYYEDDFQILVEEYSRL